MNADKIQKLLRSIEIGAEGLSGAAGFVLRINNGNVVFLSRNIEAMQVQLDNLQADLDELKKEVQE